MEICCYLDERLPAHVVGDAARLRQVLFDLVGNAIKFTEHGGVSIIAEPAERTDEIAISVRDTGIGISAEDSWRVFLEFEQADSGSTRKYGGTGLGLTISKRIVESMGGAIGLESEPGKGATFRVTIPLPRAGETDEPASTAPSLDGEDILIVTPGAIGASLIARHLQRWRAAQDRARRWWRQRCCPNRRGPRAGRSCAGHGGERGGRRLTSKVQRRVVLVTPATRAISARSRPRVSPVSDQAGACGLARRRSSAGDQSIRSRQGSRRGAKDRPPRRRALDPHGRGQRCNALLTRPLLTQLGHRPP